MNQVAFAIISSNGLTIERTDARVAHVETARLLARLAGYTPLRNDELDGVYGSTILVAVADD